MKRLEILNTEATHEYCALILTGMHGNETTPLWCGITVKSMLSQTPSDRFKKITILQGCNESGLSASAREVQITNFSDLNRGWGDETNIRKTIEEDVAQSDIVIDVHSSPNLEPCFLVDIDRYTDLVQTVLAQIPEVKISFRHSGIDSVKRYSLEQGKVGLTLELNKIGEIDSASARIGACWISELLRNFKPPSFDSISSVRTTRVLPMVEMKSPESGIFHPLIRNGEPVYKGSMVGTLFDLAGINFATITSETNGWMISVEPFSYSGRGNTIAIIQPT